MSDAMNVPLELELADGKTCTVLLADLVAQIAEVVGHLRQSQQQEVVFEFLPNTGVFPNGRCLVSFKFVVGEIKGS